MIRASLFVWPVLLCGTAGCNDAATVLGDACEPEVSVAAGAAVPPTFTWAPDCAVASLEVTTEPGNLLWQINSDPETGLTPTNRIRSGVVYGTVPAMTHEVGDGALPLAPGQPYRVFLQVLDSQGHGRWWVRDSSRLRASEQHFHAAAELGEGDDRPHHRTERSRNIPAAIGAVRAIGTRYLRRRQPYKTCRRRMPRHRGRTDRAAGGPATGGIVPSAPATYVRWKTSYRICRGRIARASPVPRASSDLRGR
jgi:hypothetical protein